MIHKKYVIFPLSALLVLAYACAPAVDRAAVKAEVEEFLNRVVEAYRAEDMGFLATAYADDPETIVFGSGTGDRFVGRDQIRDHLAFYFEDETFQYEGLTMRDLVVHVSEFGDAASFSSIVDETFMFQGAQVAMIDCRFTGALEKRDGNWVIVQQHVSVPVLDPSEFRAAIEAQNLKFAEAVQQGDAAALAALYTEDAILFPPNSEKIEGIEAVEAGWNGLIQMGLKEAILTTVEVMGAGELACEVGDYDLTIQPEGRAAVTDQGKYIVIWKRDVDGTWKLHRDIWNSNLPAQ